MTIETITQEIHEHLEKLANLQAEWEATQDAWSELASHEEEESFGDAEYAQIDAYAEQVEDLEYEISRESFLLKHLYCILYGMAEDIPYDIRKAFLEAELDIPYRWTSF